MLALVGWWFWSMRKPSGGSSCAAAPARSVAEEGELARMRAQLDQLHAGERDAVGTSPQSALSNGVVPTR